MVHLRPSSLWVSLLLLAIAAGANAVDRRLSSGPGHAISSGAIEP
jgi:hypothetical protein